MIYLNIKKIKLKLIKIFYHDLLSKLFLFIIKKIKEENPLKDLFLDLYITSLQMHPMAVYEYCEDEIINLKEYINKNTNYK